MIFKALASGSKGNSSLLKCGNLNILIDVGINFEDESGKLTLNVGNLKLDNGIIKIGMNLRVPVNTDISVVQNKFQ